MGYVTWMALLFMAATVSAQITPPITAQSLQQIAASLQMYVDMLPQIPKIYGYSVNIANVLTIPLTIGMYAKTWKFHRDLPPTPLFVYGTNQATATFPGPTIMARQGVPLSIKWENHLPANHILPWDPKIPTAIPKNSGVPTVVHLHGSAHPPASDGNPFAWFTANFAEKGPAWSQTTYTYPNIQPPGNLWYHDHALGLTRENLLAGLLGSYVIYKPIIDDPFNLPMGPEFDRHLTIVDRSFYADGTLYMNSTGTYPQLHPQWQPEYFGEAMIVNGKAWPFLNVFKRKYRFRILNACNARYLRLSFSNGLSFKIIGSDASYLAAPVMAQTILLAPAEIADVVVDFSQSTTTSAELTNNASYPFPTGVMPGPALSKIMKFNIFPMGINPPDDSTVPEMEVPYATVTNDAIITRYLTLYEKFSPTGQTTSLTINGLRLQDPATETPKTGTSELWNVINLTNDDHPFHIHLGMFQAIKMQQLLNPIAFRSCMDVNNDAIKCSIDREAAGPIIPVPDHEKTWKNIIKTPPGAMTSIIIKFKIVDNNQTYPFDATVAPHYVYHCHILDHEDNEMIRPLQLLR